MKQKILAIFLSVVMLLGMLPVGIIAGAADGETTESTLPAGTVGYFMDVPETEQFIKPKMNSLTCFGYSNRLFMSDTTVNAADPFNARNYTSDNSNGGLYVRNLDGETYLIINPSEMLVQDYKTSTSEEITSSTTDETTGITTQKVNNVVTPSTDLYASSYATSGEIYSHNGKIYFNGISSIENTSITSNVKGFGLVDDAKESTITHLAFRIKVVGGSKNQLSVFEFPSTNMDYEHTYFVEAKTGARYLNRIDDALELPEGDFDGYMVVPITVSKFQTLDNLYMYCRNETTRYFQYSNWVGRSLCLGDVYAVTDREAFDAQFVPTSVEGPDDSAKSIFTFGSGSKISHNNAYDSFKYKDYNFGIKRYYNQSADWKGWARSVTENGEHFFPFTIEDAYSGTAVADGMTMLPATYMMNLPFYSFDENGTADTSSYNDGNPLSELVTFEGSDVYGEDLSQYNYVAIRFKQTGGAEDETSPLSVNIGADGAKAISDITLVDYTSGTTTNVTSGTYLDIPHNFNGWIIVGSENFSKELSETSGICFVPALLSETSNWTNKTLYIGEMKIVKDLDTFLSVNGYVEFDVNAAADNKIVVTNDADTDKNARYSVDGENWYDIDAFNALTLEGGKRYTVYAKYNWSVGDSLISKSVFNGIDTATYLMNVEAGMVISGKDGTNGLGWANANTLRNEDNTGFYTYEGGYLHATEFAGEYYWEVIDNPDIKCHQFTIFPLYGQKVGEVYENAAERFTHAAIRIRIEDDGSNTAVEGATYPLSINLQNEIRTDGNYHWWKNTGAYFYDITTGERYVVNAGSYTKVPLGFNGYLVLPSESTVKGTAYEGDNPNTETVEDGYKLYEYSNIADFQRVHFYMHDKSDNHYCGNYGDWTGVSLFVGDIELIENDTAFLGARENCECLGIHNIKAVDAVAPSAESNGYAAHYACASCGATFTDKAGTDPISLMALENLAFYGASLTLEQNIAVNFKVNEAQLAGFENVYAKISFNGTEKIVRNPELVDGKYVFTFDGIGPQLLGKNITAQVFGTYEEIEHAGAVLDEYSVEQYCYNKLEEYALVESEKAQAFRTLLADLLYYGHMAQIYTNTDANDLVTDNIAYFSNDRTIPAVDITTGTKGIYSDLGEATELATWKGVNLYFEETVGMMFRFAADSTDGLTVRVMDAKTDGTLIEEIKSFTTSSAGGYIAYFDGLNADQMRRTVYVAVYKDGEQVSNTLAYDIVSYAKEKLLLTYVNKKMTRTIEADGTTSTKTNSWPSDPNKNLKNLVSFMMRYGDAVEAYAAVNA